MPLEADYEGWGVEDEEGQAAQSILKRGRT